MRYLFGDFVFDDGTRQLVRAGRDVPLGTKAFELLELLIRHRPQALSRTRLHAALWPSTHVGSTSLHVLVSQLRAALGDDATDPHWIRTVQRFGYAFRGAAAEEASPGAPRRESGGRSWLIQGEHQHVLPEGVSVLGRAEGIAVRVEAPGVSRQHARIALAGGRAVIEDLGSKNGTFVGNERVSSSRPLKDGDVIGLGRQVRLLFRQGQDDATESEVSPG